MVQENISNLEVLRAFKAVFESRIQLLSCLLNKTFGHSVWNIWVIQFLS